MTRMDRLRQGPVADRMAALQEIAASPSLTPDELDLVIECLGDERKSLQRRAAEAAAQAARGDPAVSGRLQEVVDNASWRQRWGAVFALSLSGSVQRSALPTLLEALDSDDGDVRWAAADLVKQLAQREWESVTAALLATAGAGTAKQRKMSLYLLRDLRFQDGVGVALAALRVDAFEVRLAGLAALVALAPDKARAAEQVVALVQDDDARMRRAAAAALGQLEVATPDVLAALQRAAQTADSALCRAAERALRMLHARD
jgi:hypothetical protein